MPLGLRTPPALAVAGGWLYGETLDGSGGALSRAPMPGEIIDVPLSARTPRPAPVGGGGSARSTDDGEGVLADCTRSGVYIDCVFLKPPDGLLPRRDSPLARRPLSESVLCSEAELIRPRLIWLEMDGVSEDVGDVVAAGAFT